LFPSGGTAPLIAFWPFVSFDQNLINRLKFEVGINIRSADKFIFTCQLGALSGVDRARSQTMGDRVAWERGCIVGNAACN